MSLILWTSCLYQPWLRLPNPYKLIQIHTAIHHTHTRIHQAGIPQTICLIGSSTFWIQKITETIFKGVSETPNVKGSWSMCTVCFIWFWKKLEASQPDLYGVCKLYDMYGFGRLCVTITGMELILCIWCWQSKEPGALQTWSELAQWVWSWKGYGHNHYQQRWKNSSGQKNTPTPHNPSAKICGE